MAWQPGYEDSKPGAKVSFFSTRNLTGTELRRHSREETLVLLEGGRLKPDRQQNQTTKGARTTDDIETGYAPVNGLEMYYEIHGAANPAHPPLVLLHGGGDTIGTSFGHVLPALARDRQIVAFEQQGYGHTADIADRPFSFEQSADDTAALLEFLHIGQADLFGFSNGGTIALQVAIRRPRVVRKLVVSSSFFKRDGGYTGFWDGMAYAQLEEDMPKELKEAYLDAAPHPENLETFFDKSAQRMRDFKDILADAIRGIAAPTLVMVGDADIVRPEHAVETFRLLPHAQLAVLPSTDHMTMMTRTAWLVPMIGEFLDAPENDD